MKSGNYKDRNSRLCDEVLEMKKGLKELKGEF